MGQGWNMATPVAKQLETAWELSSMGSVQQIQV